MGEQTSMDNFILFENDKVKVVKEADEVRIELFPHGRNQRPFFSIKTTGNGLEIFGLGHLMISPRDVDFIVLTTEQINQ